MTRFQKTMLGLLCGGMVTLGAGAGVCFAEFSNFRYMGLKLPEGSTEHTETVTVNLINQEGPIYIDHIDKSNFNFAETTNISMSNTVPVGQLLCDVTYQATTAKPGVWSKSNSSDPPVEWIHVQWNVDQDASFFSVKDQLLTDLKNREISEYIPAQITALQITANPADYYRIVTPQ